MKIVKASCVLACIACMAMMTACKSEQKSGNAGAVGAKGACCSEGSATCTDKAPANKGSMGAVSTQKSGCCSESKKN